MPCRFASIASVTLYVTGVVVGAGSNAADDKATAEASFSTDVTHIFSIKTE